MCLQQAWIQPAGMDPKTHESRLSQNGRENPNSNFREEE